MSSIRILRNGETAQVVYRKKDATWWITAYQPFILGLASGHPLEIHTPGIYMLRKKKGKYDVWCTEPTQKRETAKLRIGNKDIMVSFSERRGETVKTSF
ncbi:MAG: polysaccharide lyase beta-sandwich domain-containing protein [Bacteroides sp.]|nr:polysaccharide lyase beta-sandwich domain-containing protein [Bacteroides sp.]